VARVVTDTRFAELFVRHAVALRRTAYLLCGDWHRAEDLTQTAFAKCFAAWGRLREPAAAEAYLRSTLMHAFLDDNKRGWRREHVTADLPERPTPATDTDSRMVLLSALAKVPARQRACIVLRFYDDLSVEDTAEALGCSAGTVKSNTARGIDALRRELGDLTFDLVTTGGDTR
jgi:RNA polymerase sigma-70 factor (sigma-E family)